MYTAAHTPQSGAATGTPEYKGNDTTPTVLYVLTDHNANVIGLTDSVGRLVSQFGYTPYGDLASVEYFTPDSSSESADAVNAAKGNRLGHQGLRAERYDRPWDPVFMPITATSTTPYRIVYQNRNRMYDPAEGRFTSRDPNGLGVPALADLAFRGRAIHAGDVNPDVSAHYGNGLNAHVAYGCDPRGRQDASGLFWDEWWRDTKEGAGLLWNGAQTFLAMTDVHGTLNGVVGGLLDNYALNLDADVSWAGRWSDPDGAHTRTGNKWVNQAMLLGAYRHYNLHYWAETLGLTGRSDGGGGPMMAGIGNITSLAGRTVRELKAILGVMQEGMIFESYSLAKAVKSAKGLTSLHQAHHIGGIVKSCG